MFGADLDRVPESFGPEERSFGAPTLDQCIRNQGRCVQHFGH